MKKPSLKELKNYMVDVLGYSEHEITKESYQDLTDSQKEECAEYNAQMKTLKQVEELTGIKAANLRQRIARGNLKATKIGRDWVLSSKTVEKLKQSKL